MLDERNQLAIDHLDLVGRIVAEVASRYPAHVDRADLHNAGTLGLVEASRRFDPASGAPFARYAAIRIRGAIIDSTRSRDWATRTVRRRMREIRQATAVLEEQHGRHPGDRELAGLLGIDENELARRQAQAMTGTLLQLDWEEAGEPPLRELIDEENVGALPDAALEQRELLGTLREAVRHLPPVQADIITRYYLEGDLLQDIADDLGVTEARVSQIHSEALTSLRSFFATMYDGVPPVADNAPGKRARSAYLESVTRHSSWQHRLTAGDPLELAV